MDAENLNLIVVQEVKLTKQSVLEAQVRLSLTGRQTLNVKCQVGMTSGVVMFTITDEPTRDNIDDRNAVYSWLLAHEDYLAKTVAWAFEKKQ